MQLNGSCHCGDVKFSVSAEHPYPYNYCYCSICRKTAGGGGYAINLGGDKASLVVTGEDNISIYQAGDSQARRHFCRNCGSALWVWDSRWPELVHPFASAIDTALPVAPEHNHMMVDSKAPWVEIRKAEHDKEFAEYPNESLAEWHQRLGLVSKG